MRADLGLEAHGRVHAHAWNTALVGRKTVYPRCRVLGQ